MWNAARELDALVICGNGTDIKTLLEANIADANVFVEQLEMMRQTYFPVFLLRITIFQKLLQGLVLIITMLSVRLG